MAFGCCCQTCRVTLPPVDEFENITRVAAYPGNADTTPIEPYARGWYVFQSGSCILEGDEPNATCGRTDGTQGVCYNQNFDGTSLSNNWLATPSGIEECTAGAGESVVAIDSNCYRKTGQQVNFSHSCTPGWKGVAAYAHWPGAYGMVNTPGCDCATDDDLLQQWKYSTVSSTIYVQSTLKTTRTRGENNPCGGTVGAGGVLDRSQTIDWQQTAVSDQYGNVRRSGQKLYTAYEDNDAYYTQTEDGTGCTILQASYRNEYDGCDNCNDWNGSDYQRCSLDGFLLFPTSRFHKLLESTSAACGVVYCVDSNLGVDFSGTPAEYKAFIEGTITNLTGFSPPDTSDINVSCTLSDSKFELSVVVTESHTENPGGNPELFHEATLNASLVIELSGEHTFQSAMEDCIFLLDTWPLHDDAVYPWRTDAQTWLMPYVERDAAAIAPTINWQLDPERTCEFIDDAPYSGEIRGAPLPAGMGYHFDFNHINWMRNEDAGNCNGCEDSLGAMAASPLPKTSTRWTDYRDGSSMTGPGAHVQQRINANYSTGSPGSQPVDGVRMQKWAEVLMEWPSTNFMRPFGDDRWRGDMSAAQCITSITGTTLDLAGALSGVSAGDLVVIYGGPLNAQIWTVTSNTGTTLVLGTQFDPTPVGTVETLVQASMDEWANHAEWGTNGQVSKLRWQYDRDSTRYPWQRITGRDMAITVDPVDTYKITTPAGNQAVSGDKVIVLDSGGSQVGSTMYIKRLTDTTAELYTDTALTTQADATGAVALRGYESSYIAQSWNTDASRNTVIVRENDSQLREADADPMLPGFAETITQYTLSRVASNQCVFVASPNSQDTIHFSANGSGSLVFTWDADRVDADMCFGQEWHLDVVQVMTDPLWQTPDINCGDATQETSPCAGGASTYKYPAQVEPLLSTALPAGSPTIPGSPVWYESGGAPSAVGATFCVSQPRDRGTAHTIRDAWAGCQNQSDQRNHGL